MQTPTFHVIILYAVQVAEYPVTKAIGGNPPPTAYDRAVRIDRSEPFANTCLRRCNPSPDGSSTNIGWVYLYVSMILKIFTNTLPSLII